MKSKAEPAELPVTPPDSTGSFLGGAYVLAGAAVITRIIGAAYRVALYALLQKEGMGLLQLAIPIYFLPLAVATSGIRTATTRLVAARGAKDDASGADAALKASLWLLGLFGFALSVGIFGGSEFLAAHLTRDPRTALIIRAMAPGIFFEAVTAGYRGFFQGQQRMIPPAVSQVTEQLVRIGVALLWINALLPSGLEMAAVGSVFGTLIGSAVSLVSLQWAYRQWARKSLGRDHETRRSNKDYPLASDIRRILSIAAPIALVTGLLSASHMIDVTVIPARLQSLGLSFREATAQYGQLTGGAFPVVMLPTVLSMALQVSLIPALSKAQTQGADARVQSLIGSAVGISIKLMAPATILFLLASTEIPAVLFRDPTLGSLVYALAFAPVLMSLEHTFSGALQGLGYFKAAMQNVLIGAALQLAATYYLVGKIGILGAAYGNIGSMVACILLNLITLVRLTRRLPSPGIGTLLGVGAGSWAMFATVPAVRSVVLGIRLSSGKALSASLQLCAYAGSGVLVYAVILLACETAFKKRRR